MMKKILFAAALTSVMSASIALAEPVNIGVLGVFEIENTKNYQAVMTSLKTQLDANGCHIQREGMVVAENGDIDLSQPNQFLYVECVQPVLGSTDRQELFDPLKSVVSDLALLEGPVQRPEKGTPISDVTDRSYILKVSYYNNEDPLGRDKDLKLIGKSLEGVENIYRTEAEIAVTDAYGIKTPDEAILIYYDTLEQGEKFRSSNKQILKKIGAFNKSHLDAFIYYVAKPIR
ncbi:MAG: hypothetical protein JKX94_07715 [Sneathiella sp.]|nr:hypothetical protein [Sneathiella sp.]